MILSQADVTSNGKAILLDGAFDPMHAGHVRYLDFAASAFPSSYTRYVSVASDDDIRAKGREPLFDQMTRATVMDSLRGVDAVILKTGPTEQVIAKLRPAAYIKGRDWEGKLPPEQLTACSLYGIQIIYTDTIQDSSSGALRRWALRDADAGLDRLETFIANQEPPVPWQPVTDYSFEARKAIEGPHADLIWRWLSQCEDSDILDYGCGPGGHLVRMLDESPNRDTYASVRGYDPQAPEGPQFLRKHPEDKQVWDLVICREVLEHCTVPQAAEVVRTLFRLSAGYVYITTRFTHGSVFDAGTEFDVDPTHITLLTQPFLRSLCVLNGGKRRRDLEQRLDWQNKGRCLVYEVAR